MGNNSSRSRNIYEDIKIKIIGNYGVGKKTIGCCLENKGLIKLGKATESWLLGKGKYNENIQIEVWIDFHKKNFDYERYVPINCNAILIIFDVTNRKSFDDIKYWINYEKNINTRPINYYLVGNKIDLIKNNKKIQIISEDEIKKVAKVLNAESALVSAVMGDGIIDLYEKIISDIVK